MSRHESFQSSYMNNFSQVADLAEVAKAKMQ